MPRTKSKIIAEKPGEKSRKPRRTAYELLQDLEARRAKLVVQHEAKLALLEKKIHNLQTRHQDRIEVARILESMTPEEIEAREAEMRAQLSALKKARRIKGSNA
ncbi:MAG: hypothetical protein VKO21_08975 [Candidatus Sericytochromatia bacterium]|nr:hypothetical protein [Candidatus Sericytochromatia bacterium]